MITRRYQIQRVVYLRKRIFFYCKRTICEFSIKDIELSQKEIQICPDDETEHVIATDAGWTPYIYAEHLRGLQTLVQTAIHKRRSKRKG